MKYIIKYTLENWVVPSYILNWWYFPKLDSLIWQTIDLDSVEWLTILNEQSLIEYIQSISLFSNPAFWQPEELTMQAKEQIAINFYNWLT